ncbi:GNAT family N-acetyltransferase [Flavihumibacter rivuli]|uniref:GNAT family N-acetyltransferase n=1 Tax=Flavihumibacter rivuli TaxID=2838156 RepID=UPI001BDEF377|nr:GNAT family N-acetyltransferase [Flavihumibacter rivuli]ULQ56590.1 GNAT family N-acetyltransferase [Flavihumibacter rivuli]
MTIREAIRTDIPRLMEIRLAVKENVLSNPALVPQSDYEEFLFSRGKGWVAEIDGNVAGFAIVDLLEHNVWALFVDPAFEGMGLGRLLHDQMMDWYFRQTDQVIWLGTEPGTRAAAFYARAGWKDLGLRKNGEVYFEMSRSDWEQRK